MLIHRLVLAAAIVAAAVGLPGLAAAGPSSAVAAAGVDPFALYGSSISFDVYRDGQRIGRQRTTFSRAADSGIRVHAALDLKVKVLGFTAYSFDYVSTALWRNGEVERLQVEVDDDGKVTQIDGRATTRGFRVTGPNGSALAPAGILPTNHWNQRQVRQPRLLNTLTGEVEAVTVTDLGEATVETGSGPRRARHYRYTGGFEAESWYDDGGRWVKLRFKGRDDSTIDYVCRACGPARDVADRSRE